MTAPLLEARDLSVRLYPPAGIVYAVDGASWSLAAGRTLGVVGESGSGKTVMTLAPLGLLPPGVTADISGSLRFDGRELVGAGVSELLGARIGVVFQEPDSAFNPLRRVGAQVAEAAAAHHGLSRRAARERAVELLALVELPDPARLAAAYPHELSGGMLQRAMIAAALAADPDVLIADEPTSALDATVQAQILELLAGLQRSLGLALVLITHDIGAIARVADEIAVMYAGRIVEHGPARDILRAPRHPYTRGLLASVPARGAAPGSRFEGLAGAPPDPMRPAPGCPFAPRCPVALERCAGERPALVADGTSRLSCHLTSPNA